MSNRMVHFMIDAIDNYIATNYDIQYSLEIIGNDTADNDYYKLVTIPYLICSSSTFCFHAAMANFYDPKLIILPEIGPWKEHKVSYRRTTQNAKSGLLKHHKWIDTSSMFIGVKYLFNTSLQPSESNFSDFKTWFMS